MIWWYWILFGLGLLILELFLPSGFFIFFFGVGALLTGLLVSLGLELEPGLQWSFCTAVSIILALLFRKFLMGQWVSPNSFSNSPEGREVVISEGAIAGANGSCEYRGSRWTIRNNGEATLAPGDRALVESREGFTLLVKKIG